MKPGGALEVSNTFVIQTLFANMGTQMIEEDLFFLGKPIDDNDDVSTHASTSTKEKMCSTPPIDEKAAVQSTSEKGRLRRAACRSFLKIVIHR